MDKTRKAVVVYMYELDYIKTAIPKIEALLISKDAEIAKLKNSDFGKFKKYVSNSGAWSEYKGINEVTAGYWLGKSRPYSNPTEALEALELTYIKAQEIDNKNIEISQHNNLLREKLIMLCESTGLKKTKRQLKKRSYTKYEDVDEAWYAGLRHAGISNGNTGHRDSKVFYTNEKAKIEKWKQEIEAERLAKEKEEAAKKAEREKNLNLGYLITKYKLDKDCEEYEILDTILDKCKYLKLAHYLQKNRNDWNDGPDYAQLGLAGFTASSSTDEAIYREIYRLINDWDGDGRCFKDYEWNYSKLFAMVDEDLFSDYTKAIALV